MGLGAAWLLFTVLSGAAGKAPSPMKARHVVENDAAAAPKYVENLAQKLRR